MVLEKHTKHNVNEGLRRNHVDITNIHKSWWILFRWLSNILSLWNKSDIAVGTMHDEFGWSSIGETEVMITVRNIERKWLPDRFCYKESQSHASASTVGSSGPSPSREPHGFWKVAKTLLSYFWPSFANPIAGTPTRTLRLNAAKLAGGKRYVLGETYEAQHKWGSS